MQCSAPRPRHRSREAATSAGDQPRFHWRLDGEADALSPGGDFRMACPSSPEWSETFDRSRSTARWIAPARGEVIGKLNNEIMRTLESRPEGAAAGLGATFLAGSPADFGRLVTTETEKWER
jgi:hypothetical protein